MVSDLVPPLLFERFCRVKTAFKQYFSGDEERPALTFQSQHLATDTPLFTDIIQNITGSHYCKAVSQAIFQIGLLQIPFCHGAACDSHRNTSVYTWGLMVFIFPGIWSWAENLIHSPLGSLPHDTANAQSYLIYHDGLFWTMTYESSGRLLFTVN